MCAPGNQFVNSENEEMIVAVNAIYAIAQREPEENSGLQWGLNP